MNAERASIEAILEENELHRHDVGYIMNAYDKMAATNAALLEALDVIASVADQSGLASQSTYDGVLEDLHEMATEAIHKARGEER